MTDPLSLGIFERLEKYPDSYSDEQLRELTTHYEGQNPKGRNARIPILAFLILEEREENNYAKGKEREFTNESLPMPNMQDDLD